MGYVAMLADDMSWNHKHMGKKKTKKNKHWMYFSFQNNLCSKKKAGDFVVEMTNCLTAL